MYIPDGPLGVILLCLAIYKNIQNILPYLTIYAYTFIKLGQYTAILINDVYYFNIRQYTTVCKSRIYTYSMLTNNGHCAKPLGPNSDFYNIDRRFQVMTIVTPSSKTTASQPASGNRLRSILNFSPGPRGELHTQGCTRPPRVKFVP
jgi:hypothetical protein